MSGLVNPGLNARDIPEILIRGLKSGATVNSTAQIQSALNRAPQGSTVRLPSGTYGFTALSIPENVTLDAVGGVSVTSGETSGATVLKRLAGSTGDAVVLAGTGAGIRRIAVIGDPAATGDGIVVAAGRTFLDAVSSNGHVGNGFRFGRDDATNCNLWRAYGIIARNNTGHGCYQHSRTGFPPDVNGGLLLSGEFDLNGGDGLNLGNSWLNTFVGVVVQKNVGRGIYFGPNSRENSIFGGDQNEANEGGDIYIAGLRNSVFGVTKPTANITDVGTDTTLVVSGQIKLPKPTLNDATVNAATIRNALFPWTALSRFYAENQGTTQNVVVLEHTGNPNVGRGVAALFRTPNGTVDGVPTARDSGRLAAEMDATNTDRFRWSLNLAGVMTDLLDLSGSGLALRPVADLGIALGGATRRWSDVVSAKLTAQGQYGDAAQIATDVVNKAMSGATVTHGLLPAGCLVLGVSVRVVSAVTGATAFSVGTAADPDKWGATVGVSAGSTNASTTWTDGAPLFVPANTNVVLTAAGGDFSGGTVRVTVQYIRFTAPTS